jgi:c-di-GMP-related signal transduction protein
LQEIFASPRAVEDATLDFFFARQPILDGAKSVFGYELLFRSSFQNTFGSANGEHATLEILSNALFHTSYQEMVRGKRGLVNFTRELLLSDVILLFSPEHLVVEVLENVVPSDEILAACKRIRELGYKIALDDFVVGDLRNPLLPFADFVKVDFLQSGGFDRELIARSLLPLNVTLLAEKVETEDDYRQGLELGFKLFQGYFFSKPTVQSGKRLAPSQIACVQLIQAVFKDQCDFAELNEIVSRDMPLSYRMLRLANSPFFSFRTEITSILHAITLMGCSGMKRFVSLIAVSTAIGSKPTELALTCLTRARIGEEVAPLIGFSDRSASLFLTGLFSLLDALLDCSMEEALSELPIAQDIKSALRGERNRLRDVLDVIIAYEQGKWESFIGGAKRIGLQESLFPPIYSSAINWADGVLESL